MAELLVGPLGPATTAALPLPPERRTLRRWVLAILLAVGLFLSLPWQQTIQGTGTLIALRPEDRAQPLHSPITGFVERWEVEEGSFVTAGTPLVELRDARDRFLDSALLERVGEQVDAKRRSVAAKRSKLLQQEALLEALRASQAATVAQADNAVPRLRAAVTAAEADSAVEAARLARRRQLHADGLLTRTELEAAELAAQRTTAMLTAQRQELANVLLAQDGVRARAAEAVAKAASDRASTAAELAEGEVDLAKAESELSALTTRQGLTTIRAPRDGYVIRALSPGRGAIVKEGEPVVTIQPARPELVAALEIRPVDLPLAEAGRPVRLQFDGWPAIVVSGWPGTSVGTWGGHVLSVDEVATAKGTYRILVRPDSGDTPWPAALRPGSGVRGWTLLKTVPLGYELWRQLNAFPPEYGAATAHADDAGKKP